MIDQSKTKLAQDQLKESVAEVLLHARQTGTECLGPKEISERAGIFREGKHGNVKGFNDAIATGLLLALSKENKVERCIQQSGKNGWKLKKMPSEKKKG